MRLGLGTVRFGQPYGLAGGGCRVARDEVARMLAVAARRGIVDLDTAPSYGESESILGQALPASPEFRIVTKTPVFRRAPVAGDRDTVKNVFHRSLERLRRPGLHGLIVHDADDLLRDGGDHIFAALTDLKEEGVVARVGVSVYDARQIDDLLDRYPLDVVQAPVSALDQRLVRSGHLETLARHGVEVHARSVFLQGLLLMEPRAVPEPLAPVVPHLTRCHEELRRRGWTRARAALGFVKSRPEIEVVQCGADDVRQLEELADAWDSAPASGDWSALALDDERWLDPREWPERADEERA